MKTLDKIVTNKKVRVIKVNGNNPLRTRLMELGLVKDTVVEIVKVSPLKDPITISLRGYELTLRKTELSLIEVDDSI